MQFKAIWGIRQQLRVYDPGETVYESPQGEDSEFEVRNTPAGKREATLDTVQPTCRKRSHHRILQEAVVLSLS